MHPRVRLFGLLIVATACWNTAHAETRAPVLEIEQGRLIGVEQDGIHIYRGIPFAGDTGGHNRWRPPSAPPRWEGVKDATRPGPICPQSSAPRNGVVAPWLKHFEINEDCLNLTVYRPATAGDNKHPVMVWIHGGFARLGTGSRHDGTDLAREGVVVVTLNYRLDRLGQFAHPAITAEQPDGLLGNYGLMDIQAALRWVKANIAHFGGDPDNVTVFGHSSGGVAVTALLGSPLSSGLFERAISQSGTVADMDQERHLSEPRPGVPSLEDDGRAMAQALLPPEQLASTDALRKLSWQQIIAYTETQPATALMPVVDGKLLPEPVAHRFLKGTHIRVPFMVGANSWEQSLFANFKFPLAALLSGVTEAEVRAVYAGLNDKDIADAWLADTGFHAPNRFLASAHTLAGVPTWVYRFDHVPAGLEHQPGAAHADAVNYLFDPVALPNWPADNPTEAQVARTLKSYWVNFARHGNPNGPGLPQWPAWDVATQPTQIIEATPRTEPAVWKQRMDFHFRRYAEKGNVLSVPE